MISALPAALLAVASFAAPIEPPKQDQQQALWASDRDARLAWWRDARFGMFIHWGLYSGAGGAWNGTVYKQHYAEWIQNWAAVPCGEYARQMKPRFKPVPGFADAWASLAADAGMKYAVLTAKHHEGFTLFNSKAPYSLDNPVTGGTNISPPGRDVAREFADAMRAKGLRAGFYYSLLDWQHPDAYPMALPNDPKPTHPRDPAVYKDYVRGHVDELLHHYGPLCTIWFDYSDGQRQGEAWGAAQLMADMRAAQPKILVNNRLYEGLENKLGDYGTPEKYVPPTGLPGMDWEVNHTLNESYGFSSHDVGWKDTKTVVRLLADIVSKGGNLLLNIGPDSTGAVPEQAQATLKGVGAWMRTHGEAIYGTTASPFENLPWGRATQKPGTLYLMVFDWPADGRLIVPMKGAVRSARILGSSDPVAFKAAGGRGELTVPTKPADANCTVIRLDLDGEVLPTPFAILAGADGTFTLPARQAKLTGPSLRVETSGPGEKANIGYWSDPSASAAWPLAVLDGQAAEYRVEADLACADAAAGADLVFDVGAAALPLKVPATGGWQSYRTVDLGKAKLAAGDMTVKARALNKPGEAVVNIREVRLIRVRP